MNCARRNCVYALMGLFVCMFALKASGREPDATASKDQFEWSQHTRLSWDDFKGAVNARTDESAAATCCSIGIKTTSDSCGNPQIVVYNTFYANKSWVKSDAHIQSILDHEQGHFDLCEVYTRKLRRLVNNCDCSTAEARQHVISIYTQLSAEYEARQQAYEQETTHGTNIPEQQRWEHAIAGELM